MPHYEITTKRVDSLPMAAVRRLCSFAELPKVIPAACGEVWDYIRKHNIAHTGMNAVVYLDDKMNVLCGVIVEGAFEPSGAIERETVPDGLVATTVHWGPYHLLGQAHNAVLDWCRATGRRLDGLSWEIYGHWSDDPKKLRTDVYWLLKEMGAGSVCAELCR